MVLAHVLLVQSGIYTIREQRVVRSIYPTILVGISVGFSTGAGGLVFDLCVVFTQPLPLGSMISVKISSLFYFQNILFAMLFSEIFSVTYHPESRRVNKF